jgi:hypothetical protein
MEVGTEGIILAWLCSTVRGGSSSVRQGDEPYPLAWRSSKGSTLTTSGRRDSTKHLDSDKLSTWYPRDKLVTGTIEEYRPHHEVLA